jgi:hypothetical protein
MARTGDGAAVRTAGAVVLPLALVTRPVAMAATRAWWSRSFWSA